MSMCIIARSHSKSCSSTSSHTLSSGSGMPSSDCKNSSIIIDHILKCGREYEKTHPVVLRVIVSELIPNSGKAIPDSSSVDKSVTERR